MAEAEQRVVAQRTDRAERSLERARAAQLNLSRTLGDALGETILSAPFEAYEILRLLTSGSAFEEEHFEEENSEEKHSNESDGIQPAHILFAFLVGQLPASAKDSVSDRTRVASNLSNTSDGKLSREQALRCLAMAPTSEFVLTYFLREALEPEQRIWCLEMCVEAAFLRGSISHHVLEALRGFTAVLDVPATTVDELLEAVRQRSTGSDDQASDDRTGTGSKSKSRTSTRWRSSREQACDVLGVAHDADVATIRIAYRKLVRVSHPDLVPELEREAATRRTSELNAAYRLLVGGR